MRKFFVAVTFFLISIFFFTAPAVATATSPSNNQQKWTLQLEKSKGSIEFNAVGRPGALKIHGVGEIPKGTVNISQGAVEGSAVFPLDTLDTGIKLRNEHMKNKYLETSKFPNAKLTLTSFKLPKDTDLSRCSIKELPFEGLLNLHGVEKPVKGTSTITCTPEHIEIQSQFDLKIDDFNVNVPSFAGITMAKDVSVKVALNGTLTASK